MRTGSKAGSPNESFETGVDGEPLFKFLDRLGQEIARSTDADTILAITTRLTAQHLGLSNCAYADMDEDEDGFTIRGNWHAAGSPSIVGRYSLADFGTLAVRELSAGRPLIINDNLKEIEPSEAKTFQDIGIGATICMPLVKAGRLRALMAIHDKDPHYWSDYELKVIREVTERSWAHVERVRAEAELRASNKRFRAAIQATRGVLWTNDAQGRMVGEQPGWAALTGQHYDDYQGYGWSTAVHPDDAPPTVDAWNEAVRERKTFIFEHRIRRADGEWRLFSIRAVPVLDDNGEVTEWVGVHTDITEERLAENALREESRILETLNTTGATLAAQLDLEAIVQNVTDAGVELTGAAFGAFFYNVLDESGEKYLLYSLAGADRSDFERFGLPRATAVFHPTFTGAAVVRSDDITQDDRYGKNDPHHGMPEGHLPVRSYLAVPVVSRSGEVIGGLFFGHPQVGRFTERHERLISGIAAQAAIAIDNARLYQAVQQANETLEQRVEERSKELRTATDALAQAQKLQALGELTGGIAHDFNNLMTVVEGSSDLLLRRPDLPDEKRRQYLQAIADTAKRATTLTSQLLAFGRRQTVNPEVIDVDLRLDAFAEVLSRTLGPQIEFVLDLGASQLVEVDPTQLETAVLNAALNARDAMPHGGRLVLATSVDVHDGRPHVRLSICDNGLGMPQRVVERAFEPFFTTKEVGKGTGLGLSQIHGFAAQAGGRAEIMSEEGKGTTISIILPTSDRQASQHTVRPSSSALPPGLRVLLVEDNQQVREFAQELLQDLGCRVLSADGAEQALHLLGGEAVDLVLTDVVMPGTSGVELARKVRERWPRLPILLATGYSEEILKNAPEFTVLPKPYGATSLLEGIAGVLDASARGAGHS